MAQLKKNFYMTERQVQALDELHRMTDIKPSEHVRRALDFYISEQEKLLNLEAYSLGRPKKVVE